jgi:serine phosphatase RsbU (regulator of sigma subunit)
MDACAWADLIERLPRHLPPGLALGLCCAPHDGIEIGHILNDWPWHPVPDHPEIHLRAGAQQLELAAHLVAALCTLVHESQSLSAELAATYGKLALLDEMGRILPRCQDAAAVGHGLADSLADSLPGAGCLFERQQADSWRRLAHWGPLGLTDQRIEHEELEALTNRERTRVLDADIIPRSMGLGAGVTGPSCCVPLRGPEGIEGMLLLARPGGAAFASDEAKLAELAAVQCGGYLFKLRRDRALRQAALLEHEVGLAGRIQQQLLPATLPAPPGWILAGALHSARLVGGDLYDALELEDGLYLVIADVSGHSVPAALAMSMVRTALHAALPQIQEPADLIAALNRQLADDLFAATLFVSLTVLRIDPESGAFTLANAGHPPVLLRHADGSVTVLDADGCVLGLTPEQRPDQLRGELLPGDTVLLYTDGLIELDGRDREPFGQTRLQQAVATGPAHAADLLHHVEQQLTAWSGHRHDDTTLLACSRNPDQAAPHQCRLSM